MIDTTFDITVPPFVGEDYFCESGLHEPWEGRADQFTLYPNDILWDGQNCLPSSNCCSLSDGRPYFIKQLAAPTTDDVEARMCFDTISSDEDVAVELVELYVQ